MSVLVKVAQAAAKAIRTSSPDAVACIIDALLNASELSPSLLLAQLLDIFSPELQASHLLVRDHGASEKEDEHCCDEAIITALLHLLQIAEGAEINNNLEMVFWKGCVPILGNRGTRSYMCEKVSKMLAQSVAQIDAWDYVLKHIAPACLRSIIDNLCLKDVKIRKSTLYIMEQGEKGNLGDLENSRYLPISSSCQLIGDFLTTACQVICDKHIADASVKCKGSTSFCIFIIAQFWDPVLAMFCQPQDSSLRHMAMDAILPSLLGSAEKLMQNSFLGSLVFSSGPAIEVWNCCKILLSLDRCHSSDVYIALAMFYDYFLPLAKDPTEKFDIRKDVMFWEVLKVGLVDEERLTRKRASYVLKLAIEPSRFLDDAIYNPSMDMDSKCKDLSKKERWAEQEAVSTELATHKELKDVQHWEIFLLLYDILEEYGLHLVEAAWTEKMSMLLTRLETSDLVVRQMKPDIDSTWTAVLWHRGLKHGNPQVRRLILQSFLELNCRLQNVQSFVPKALVLGPLLDALNDPIQHRDFGLGGNYISGVGKDAGRFFVSYVGNMSLRDRGQFLNQFIVAVLGLAPTRPGLMTFASLVGAIAVKKVLGRTEDGSTLAPLQRPVEDDEESRGSTELLQNLKLIVESSRIHFNASYRAKVCNYVMLAACALVVLPAIPVDKFLHFLSAFPREILVENGHLHNGLMCWLNPQSSSKFHPQEWIRDGLHENLQTFLRPADNEGGYSVIGDEDLNCWKAQAERWARLFVVGLVQETAQVDLLKLVQESAEGVYNRVYMSSFVPTKVLLLFQCLVKECGPSNDSLTGLSRMKKLLSGIIRSVMGELVSHAEASLKALWDHPYCGPMILPGDITGKLGGRSQRRLPHGAASSVLQSVLAVEVISECVVFCFQSQNDELPEYISKFFRYLVLEVVMKPKTQKIGDEFRLAEYEALASVLEALASIGNKVELKKLQSVINDTNHHVSLIPSCMDKGVFDSLVGIIESDIDNIIKFGGLARSRWPVLLLHKWRCLAAILSLPNSSKGACWQEDTTVNRPSLISETTLYRILEDALSSLESAGAEDVLPLLRCLRKVFYFRILDYHKLSDIQPRMELIWRLVRSAWALIADCSKRKVAPIAAFLSAVLHPEVFKDVKLHDCSGPLKWLVYRLIELGCRSPRTMRLTTLQLTGLWLKFPATIPFYVKEIIQLSLHGGDLVDEELDGELLEGGTAAKEYFELMKSTDPELTEAFTNSEIYVRVAVAVMIDKLASNVEGLQESLSNANMETTLVSQNCGQILLLELLKAVVDDPDLSKELYKKKSAIHRRKVRAWQMLCILSRFAVAAMLPELLPLLELCLYKNNMPSVRQYIEMFAIQIYLRFPNLVIEHLLMFLRNHNLKPQALSSYVFISAKVLLHVTSDCLQESMLSEILPAILPHMTTHHHSLRCFSQVLIHQILERFYVNNMPPDMCSNDLLERKCLTSLADYLSENMDFARIRLSISAMIDNFDPSLGSKPRGIFCDNTGDPAKALEARPFECVPAAIVDELTDFLNEAREGLRESVAADAVILSAEALKNKNDPPMPNGQLKQSKDAQEAIWDYQRKITPISASVCETVHGSNKYSLVQDINDMDLLLKTVNLRMKQISTNQGSRQDLIVVASLLDRIPNLAGLTRTCEVFQAACLIVHDARILEDRQFKLISVTAEQWIPVKEVPVSSLKLFLKQKRNEGYTLVGLEQTANSTPLNEYSFPKKVVLLLGREKEGIPVELIQALDTCLEIPQLGLIRSLNVHVSGGIAIWEYTRQHLKGH